MKPRRWTINGRFLTQPVSGVQRYGREIVLALDQHLANGHPQTSGLQLELLMPADTAANIKLEHIPIRMAGRSGGYVWEQVSLPRYAAGNILSLCNVGPLAARRAIVCIHDVNTRVVPASYSWKFRLAYRFLIPALGQAAACTTTVSHYSAGALSAHGVAAARKITVIPDGHEHALRWAAVTTSKTRRAARPDTIVVIGSRAPHKNIGFLVGLAARLKTERLRLAITGMEDARVFAADGATATGDNIEWLGRLNDGELAEVLQHALCLAVPSLTEGFGLPAVEAMALGCAVVASNRGSLPEICGSNALYAAPDDADGWVRNFVRLRDDAALRDSLKQSGPEAAAAFSWSRSAERYLDVMASIDRAPA